MADNRARRMWKTLEPYHAITYFAPDTRRETDALGVTSSLPSSRSSSAR